ncbi:uncharacterized protein B0T15DRAFT_511603 [Chaetomium strumarium]|uniref:Histone-lysine N-methyltransferase SET5 n=1 Tax=Chaetomium strumarium TaxID=1170767 RepID=A0AAJ0GT89_9PEZI|nr:hypothetical protein B0T15DRAFT_511603 [Chaetomium strumarium]
MSSDHRYRLLKVPSDAPFELRPSPGKGWGAFATRPIKRGILIMIEDPLVVMHKSANEITKTSRGPFEFKNLLELFNEKAFPYHNLGLKGSPAWGLFALHSRFNHSCLPNCVVPTNDDQHIMSFATKDIALGEEITFCYSPHFKGSTRRLASAKWPSRTAQ